jgi:ABC-type sugar transport system substrate-binding protein
MTMLRSFSRSWAVLSCLILVAPGCGKDPFAPPTRLKPTSTSGEVEEPRPPFLVYLVPGVPKGDLEVWGTRAQVEANDKRAIFRIMGPGPGETPDKQPEIVRKALTDGASALIVYPGDSPELPKALAEAESKGVPVVLIDKALVPPEGSKPFTMVEHGVFDEMARKIVAATIDDLKKAARPLDGTALVLVDKVVDGTSGRRVSSLKSAAEAAKFRQVVPVSFDASVENSAKLAVLEAVKANPDVSVVLADDAEGLMGAGLARAESRGKPVFFVGGFTDYRTSQVYMPPVRESCYVEGRYSELGGLAVVTALARLRGETVSEHSYLTPRFTKAEGAVSTENNPNSSIPGPKSSESLKDILKEITPPGGSKPQ